MGFDGSGVASSIPTEPASGLMGITVSRVRIDSVARKDD
jgi:hypothetical protein